MQGNLVTKNDDSPTKKEIFEVKVIQKGNDGCSRSGQFVTLYFEPSITMLPPGNQDYIRLDKYEYESELHWIRKGTKIKVGLVKREYMPVEIVSIGV
jgi:hypothetical protein